MPPDLGLWLTFISSDYPYPEHSSWFQRRSSYWSSAVHCNFMSTIQDNSSTERLYILFHNFCRYIMLYSVSKSLYSPALKKWGCTGPKDNNLLTNFSSSGTLIYLQVESSFIYSFQKKNLYFKKENGIGPVWYKLTIKMNGLVPV